jgi:hypothetical protein
MVWYGVKRNHAWEINLSAREAGKGTCSVAAMGRLFLDDCMGWDVAVKTHVYSHTQRICLRACKNSTQCSMVDGRRALQPCVPVSSPRRRSSHSNPQSRSPRPLPSCHTPHTHPNFAACVYLAKLISSASAAPVSRNAWAYLELSVSVSSSLSSSSFRACA